MPVLLVVAEEVLFIRLHTLCLLEEYQVLLVLVAVEVLLGVLVVELVSSLRWLLELLGVGEVVELVEVLLEDLP